MFDVLYMCAVYLYIFPSYKIEIHIYICGHICTHILCYWSPPYRTEVYNHAKRRYAKRRYVEFYIYR